MINLYPEQQKAFEFATTRDEVALFAEQRTGKTFVTLKLLEHEAHDDFCGILICLLTNRDTTWRDKIAEFVPQLQVTTEWETFKKLTGPRLFVIHFNILSRWIAKLVKYKKFNWACIDEAHALSKRGTKQSRAAARLAWIKRKVILTGTPIEKQPMDLFAQFRFLAPNVFGTNWAEFEEEYVDLPDIKEIGAPKGSQAWQKLILRKRIMRNKAPFNKRKMPKFIKSIKPYSFRMTKADVGIIEPEVHKVVVPIVGKQREYYDAMRKKSVVRLATGERSMAELKVTRIMKERQIASGFLYDDNEEVHHVGNAKLRRLIKMIDTLPKPVVVFTAFRPDLELIVAKLRDRGLDVVDVHGKVNKKKRPDIWRKFQRADYDVIVCQIKTGGVGVDLWKANTAIIHSMGHSFIDFDQAKARLDSIMKNKAAKIYVLCSGNTVDEDIYDLVVIKRLNGEEVLSQLRKGDRNVHQRSSRSKVLGQGRSRGSRPAGGLRSRRSARL